MLWKHLSLIRKRQCVFILTLMIISSVLEVLSLGAVVPFLGVLTSPEYVFQHQLSQPLIQAFSMTSPRQLVLSLTCVFVGAVLISGMMRLLLLYMMTKVSLLVGADISIDIYRRTLYQKYSVHASRNSSEVINGIITKSNVVVSGVLTPILVLVSSFILFLGIMSALLAIDPKAAVSIFLCLGIMYSGVIYYSHRRLKANSLIFAKQSNLLLKTLQEGLGGIRDVILDGSQEFYCHRFRESDLVARRASGFNQFIAGCPRFIVESLGMSFIAVIAYFMILDKDGSSVTIPILGAIALGAQKLLPAIQTSYSSYANIKGSEASFQDVIDLLDQDMPMSTSQSAIVPLGFKKSVILENISFSYANTELLVLQDFSLEIPKGSHVGFIGETGSGKSTTIDIIMGLMVPTVGRIMIDGEELVDRNTQAWQKNITHVPQSIFLADGTIEENIAYGEDLNFIDHERMKVAADQAQISRFIEGLEAGYKSQIGENGVRLSGGQRQRLGIARALYKSFNVIVFDEATSSLDEQTEDKVMQSIKNLNHDSTVLIIAHRMSTLKNCDFIVEVKKDGVFRILDYSDIKN